MGLVVALFFCLSISSFATDTVNLGFPYFGYARLRKGSSAIFTGVVGSDPITGINQTVTDSVGSSSSITIDLFSGGQYSKSFNGETYSFSYPIPEYDIRNQTDSGDQVWNVYTTNNPNNTGSTSTIFYDDRYEYLGLEVSDYVYKNISISSGSSSVSISNNTISGGDYIIFGHFDYAHGAITDINDLFTGECMVRVFNGNNYTEISGYDFSKALTLSSANDSAQFAISFSVPYSMEFNYISITLNTKSSFTSQILEFGVSTGGFEYKDNVSSIGGLSAELAGWFSGLKSGIASGFAHISDLIKKRDNDASEAASNADNSQLQNVQSEISNIEQFETITNNAIQSQMQNIDFSIPSSYGGALAAISFMFTSIFNSLGVYQYVIMMPLVLGIMLLLLGRGSLALGHILSTPIKAVGKKDGE